MATPSRSPSTSVSASPESAHASRAATSASCPERSRRLALTRSSTSVGSTATSAAIRVLSCSAHSCSRGRTPDWPASRAAQVVGTSPPTGEVVPSPVTTTRVALICSPRGVCAVVRLHVLADGDRRAGTRTGESGGGTWRLPPRHRRSPGVGWSAVLAALDEGDGVAHGLEVLDLVVGDLDVELLLGGHDDLDHGQRVDVEVVDERLVELDVVGGNAGDLVDDVSEVGADLFGGCHVTGTF